jgi:hypothetical protein
MKNPRFTMTSSERRAVYIGSDHDSVLSEAIAHASALADKTSGFDSALQFLKFSEEDIKQFDKIKDSILTLASTGNWIVAAVGTIKSLLTMMGVFSAEKDQTQLALQAIGQRVEQIYGYLKNSAKNSEYKQAEDWRIELANLRTSIKNLAFSRSSTNLNDVRLRTLPLQTAILQMLAIPYGSIPFLRSTYGYSYTPPDEPTHWIDYAIPLYMSQSDGTPVAYAAPGQELQAMIWDPGYYIDVLIQAIETRISALTVTEPGFRSTAFDRDDLRHIYMGLEAFIREWEHSMMRTRIVGPIDPGLAVGGPSGTGHPLHHPWGEQNKIPMGVVDPVSGVSVFQPNYSDGFQLWFVQWYNASGGYWVLTNYDDAIKDASQYLSNLHSQVRAKCGISTLYSLRNSIGDLIMGPIGSEFVDISPLSFQPGSISYAGDESVSLGLIGAYSGHPGKTYDGKKYLQSSSQLKCRIPMARRMDVSGIQVGYKLGLSVGSAEPERIIELTPFSSAAPGNPAFPSGTITYDVQSDSATVYDVYQSDFFSIEEEEQYQNTGSVPWHFLEVDGKPFTIGLPKNRLFLNPRTGKVRATVVIDFELDESNPEIAFIGHANVSVANVDPEQYSDGYMLSIHVYETVIGTTGVGAPDAPMTKLADSVTLFFVPAFLVLGTGYFNDRETGLKNMRSMVDKISHQYVRYKARVGPGDPITQVERIAHEERVMEKAFADFRHSHPSEEAALVARFQRPSVKNVLLPKRQPA